MKDISMQPPGSVIVSNRRAFYVVIGLALIILGVYVLYDNIQSQISHVRRRSSILENNLRSFQRKTSVMFDQQRKMNEIDRSQKPQAYPNAKPATVEMTRKAPDNIDDDDDHDLIIMYNRVPKTGSTTFAGIFYHLCYYNNFSVVHLGVDRPHYMLTTIDQVRYVTNITTWKEKMPGIYHGHVAHIDFDKYGVRRPPIYINMIREPLSRLVSHHYFQRNGDNYRPDKIHSHQGDNTTFDECVLNNKNTCRDKNIWFQIRFFCGHHEQCLIPGNQWALEEAKRNVLRHYLVVGVTEEIADFVGVVETLLPRFFRGATAVFNKGQNSHLRYTTKKLPPKPETVKKLQKSAVFRMEKDFYNFVLKRFHFLKQDTLKWGKNNQPLELSQLPQMFHIGKVHPEMDRKTYTDDE